MKYLLLILILLWNSNALAEAPAIALTNAHVDARDMSSVKRGAKFFVTNCMICHTLIYLRYDKVAEAAGITYEKMPINVKTWPFGIKPPDLSLESNVRGPNWIYTYLHSFYVDPARPTGFNNLLYPNTAMAGILVPYQGKQVLAKDLKQSHRIFGQQWQWYDVLEAESAGILSPDEFDSTIRDVVNFLTYAADPYYAKQVKLGYWVIGFLLILFVLVYLLKKEYWKDISRNEQDE